MIESLATPAVVGTVLLVLATACLHVIRQVRRRIRGVAALPDAMRSTLRAYGREEAVDELLEGVRRLLRVDHAWLLLLPAAGGPPLGAQRSDEAGQSLRPVSLGRHERALVDDVRGSTRALTSVRRGSAALREVLAERELRHGIATLVRGETGPLGVLLAARSGGRRFSPDERDLLDLVADHAGVALENDQLGRSVRELTTLKEELRHRADHDSLTGLPNRTLFAASVARALSAEEVGGPIAVLFLDLDDFKDVNDTLGHAAGDELLTSVARRLSRAIRPTDVAARLGGDEFAVLVRCVDPLDGERVADRVVEALDGPFAAGGRELAVHSSIGIAYGTPGSISADDLMRNADVAMYEAKQAGKRRHARFAPHMQQRIRERHELVTALERSIARGEIQVHYQPIVDLASHRLVAVEALARWRRNELGLMQPNSFIPVADEVGLMVGIGLAVLEESCRQARAWQQAFPSCDDLEVTVNLAPSQLNDPTIVEDVAEVLERTGLDPSRLVLEITEDGVMRKPDAALRAMHELRDLGVTLALDDFGTGHSSLAHLREFPLDTLKIARPFVVALEEGERDAAFVETIVRLASSLELRVVAEGIETFDNAAALAALGCELGQGFYFGQPLSPLGLSGVLTADRLPPRVPSIVAA